MRLKWRWLCVELVWGVVLLINVVLFCIVDFWLVVFCVGIVIFCVVCDS